MEYIVKENFKGSPTGARVVEFEADQKVEHTMIGDDLAAVALDEGWIEEIEEIGPTESELKAQADAEAAEKEAAELAELEAQEKAEQADAEAAEKSKKKETKK